MNMTQEIAEYVGLNILTIVVLVYFSYKLELKNKVRRRIRWIIIFSWSFIPAIAFMLSMYRIEFLEKIISLAGNYTVLIFPFLLLVGFVTFYLDGQLYQLIYHRHSIYSSDDTAYVWQIYLVVTILFAVLVNLLINKLVDRSRKG